MFGAVADGTTNNDAAFTAINLFVAENGASQLNLSAGTYLITQWDIPEKLRVIGQGKSISFLQCAATTTVDWFIRCCGSTSEQWISELHGLAILGKGKCQRALFLTSSFATAAVSKAHISSLEIKGGQVALLTLDATQNSLFQDLNIVGTDSNGLGSQRGIEIVNGAANNLIIACEVAGGIDNIYMNSDPTLGGASVSGLQSYPNANVIFKCILEKMTDATYTRQQAINLVNGNKNVFDCCEMLCGSVTGILVSGGSYNKFSRCNIGSNSQVSIPAVINAGYGTIFEFCNSENINGVSGTYHAQVSNATRFLNNTAGSLLKWRAQNTAGNTANNIRYIDPVSYSSNAANVPPSQLDSGLMAVNSGSQLFLGTPAGIKQVALYTQKSVSTSLLTYTAGSGSNTLSLTYQLTDGFASEINIVVRGNTDRSHRAVIRINAEFTSATVAWSTAQIISAVYNDAYLSGAVVSVSSSGMLTLLLTTNPTITEGDYRLDERILINIA